MIDWWEPRFLITIAVVIRSDTDHMAKQVVAQYGQGRNRNFDSVAIR